MKKTKKESAYHRFMRLTPEQRAAQTKEFDQPFIAETFGRAPRAAQTRIKKILKRGRPKIGQGAQRVLVTVERTLLARADAEARRRKISRAELVAEGLQLALAQ